MHTPLQCAEPQLNSCFCVDPEMARADPAALPRDLADSPDMVHPGSFPDPGRRLDTVRYRSFRFHFDRRR